MNKEKEIEEMAKYFCGRRNRICKLCCSFTGGVCVENCKFLQFAKDLHNAGYGNVKQAVQEFAETLRKKAKLLYEPNREWYENVRVNEIDDLIVELYGADE